MTAVAEPELLAVQHAATAIINEVGNTLLSSWTAPCELGWLGGLCGASGIDGGPLLRCNACKRLVLAARAAVHAQQCVPPSSKQIAGKPAGTAVATAKRSRDPACNGASKASNKRVSDSSAMGAGGNKDIRAPQSAADIDGRPTKLSKVSYPDAAQRPMGVPQRMPAAGHAGPTAAGGLTSKSAAAVATAGAGSLTQRASYSLVPYSCVPRRRRSQRRPRSTAPDVGWMFRETDAHPPYSHNPAAKKNKLGVVGGAAQRGSKIKMLDGLASAHPHASSTGQGGHGQHHKQHSTGERQGQAAAGTGARSATTSPSGGQRAQQGRGGKPQVLHGAALKASLQKREREKQAAAAAAGVSMDDVKIEVTAHPSTAGTGMVGNGTAAEWCNGVATGTSYDCQGTAAAVSNGAGGGLSNGGSSERAGAYLDSHKRMMEDLRKRLAQPQGGAVACTGQPTGAGASHNTSVGAQQQQQQQQQQHSHAQQHSVTQHPHTALRQQHQQQQHAGQHPHAAARQPSGSWGGAAAHGAMLSPHPSTLARSTSVGGHTPSSIIAAHGHHAVAAGMHHAVGMMMPPVPMAYQSMVGAMSNTPMMAAHMHAHLAQAATYPHNPMYMAWHGAYGHTHDMLGRQTAAGAAHKASAQQTQHRQAL